MYKTDGSVHYDGIENEINTINLLNSFSIYEETVQKRGGTKQKEDAIAGNQKISIKKKSGLQNGSFDWINTSKYNDVISDNFKSFIENVKEFRTLPESILKDNTFIEQVRDKFNVLCDSCLNGLTDKDIKYILENGMRNCLVDFDIVVNDTKAKTVFVFPFENHPVNHYLNNNYTISLQGKGKSSRKVIFSDGVNEYDCGLRIRITSNNGINAFLGLSKANKNSQVVIKLQQDNIKELLSSTKHKKYDY